MIFSKRSALLVTAILFLSACSQMPTLGKPSTKKPDEEEAVVESTDTDVAPETPFVAIAKPQSNKSVSVPSQARDEFSKAKQAMLRKNWQEAQNILSLMTDTYPELAGVYTNLGIVYERMEQPEKAENAYRFAIKTNPLNFDAYTNLGVLLRDQGKFEQAEENYLAALKQWPHHQASLINLGILYDMYLGQLDTALAHYQLAQKLNNEEDRKLKGWIIDLQRRLPKKQSNSASAAQ